LDTRAGQGGLMLFQSRGECAREGDCCPRKANSLPRGKKVLLLRSEGSTRERARLLGSLGAVRTQFGSCKLRKAYATTQRGKTQSNQLALGGKAVSEGVPMKRPDQKD